MTETQLAGAKPLEPSSAENMTCLKPSTSILWQPDLHDNHYVVWYYEYSSKLWANEVWWFATSRLCGSIILSNCWTFCKIVKNLSPVTTSASHTKTWSVRPARPGKPTGRGAPQRWIPSLLGRTCPWAPNHLPAREHIASVRGSWND